MFTAKSFYKEYIADDVIRPLNQELNKLILHYEPRKVFEFGCGQGKNLKLLKPYVSITYGIDISEPAIRIAQKHVNAQVGTQKDLQYVGQFDVAFTCSVLDHIKDSDQIIPELRRIAPVVLLAETNDRPYKYYYPHDYESFGFQKLGYTWQSPPNPDGDGAIYHIWRWTK